MSIKTLILALAITATTSPAFANPDAIVVRGGDLRIRDAGSGLVFPDGSIQYKATVAGPSGPTGPEGPANTLTIGNVIFGSQPAASITGTPPNQTLNLILPQGPKGDVGPQGSAGSGAPLSVYDGDNTLLGSYLGMSLGGGSRASFIYLSNGDIYVLSPEGFVIPRLNYKYYQDSDCQGTLYIKEDNSVYSEQFLTQRPFVLSNTLTSAGSPLYRKLNQKPSTVTYNSTKTMDDPCINSVGTILGTPVQSVGTIPNVPPSPITIK